MLEDNQTKEIDVSIVFKKNYKALVDDKVRNIVNEGGSRSTKTYSLCQLLVAYCLQNAKTVVKGKAKATVIRVYRKALTTLRDSVCVDFNTVIEDMGVGHMLKVYTGNKPKILFNNGAVIEFKGADEQNLRGVAAHISWMNEANELSYEEHKQIAMRTTQSLIYDYNPSMNSSWLYDLPEDRTVKIHSTYKDNPFLGDEQIREIEDLKDTDPDYYAIFALGKRVQTKENVYSEWEVVRKMPAQFDPNKYIYGLDFGFDHPNALVKIYYTEKELYLEQTLYENNLTTPELIEKMKARVTDKNKFIVADYARPEIIADLNKNGFRVQNAIKDVKDGIMNVKSFKVYVNYEAAGIIKENQLYKWKKVNGIIIDEPVKLYDDTMDAIRYGVFHIKRFLVGPVQAGSYSFNF